MTHPYALTGKVIIVTGGGRGLGLALSSSLVGAGAHVVITGRDENTLRTQAEHLGSSCSYFAGDLSDAATPARIIAEVVARHGSIDGIVNNAGTAPFGPVEYLDPIQVDHVLDLDVRAPLLLTAAATPHLARGASIVNISSAMSAIGQPMTSLYAAAKGALDAGTRALAAELGVRGVRVNAIRPGLTRTDATAYAYSDQDGLERYHRTVPLGRTGTADEAADLVHFLLSDAAAFITGQIIAVDGGHTTANLAVFAPTDQPAKQPVTV